jgi:hypothetical protein
MPLLEDKVMFEVYRDLAFNPDEFRVVYYTELDEHNKDFEISRAQKGETFLDGFLLAFRLEQAKRAVSAMLDRLNRGEPVTPDEFRSSLTEYLPASS